MSDSLDQVQIRRLLDIGRGLVTKLSLPVVLDEILQAARELTGARYAALGVLDGERTELERFLTLGIEAKTRRAIGDLPRGRGVLGVLIGDPKPLRADEISAHPRSYGFPDGHPPMHGFLGVPIVIRGESWGNLYLTEKKSGAFTEADEEAVVILAEWAATAIDNARLYETSERRRAELERAVRGFEATHDVALAIGRATSLDRVLELIVKRGRALVGANTALIMLREEDSLVVAAAAGHAVDAQGVRLPIDKSTSGQVLEHARSERISDVSTRLRIAPAELGVPEARTALLVPMTNRGQTVGVIAAFDRGPAQEVFSEDDEQLLRMFAATAANGVVMAQSVEADRLRSALAAADEERARWARELHDDTLQGLGALKVLLSSILQHGDPEQNEAAMREAIEEIETAIGNLRGIITDLRPAALDDLGLRAALTALIERRHHDDLEITGDLRLPDPRADEPRLSAELETIVYRLVQEALHNVVKHARARHVHLTVAATEGEVMLEVRDDGVGFAVAEPTGGFGLKGMHERVYLGGGRLEIQSGPEGTVLHAVLPARRGSDVAEGSRGQQAAS
ncbi:MAG TPA: GAF domain-containing sensor histidine kinase [Solirubrobacteraceae bacterium]|nr:GAF domain-containing sensor histidine kinase [Solirubrobacteraceae bacterium]